MALEDILKKIKEDTDSQVSELRNEYEKEKKTKLDDFNDYAEQFLEKAKKLAEEKAKLHKERLISRAQADANLEVLKKKQQLLDRVYKTAKEKIKKSDQQLELFSNIVADIAVKEGIILVPKNSALDSENFTKAISQKITGTKFEIKPVDDFEMGFMLESGKIRYDNTVESLIDQAREILQDRLVDILFGDKD